MRDLVKKLIPKSLFRLIEPYGHWGEAVLANIRYGFPARGLQVIGVTGTDGKTTTATLITTMLRQAGYKVGMMTTISIDLGKGPEPNPTRLTTITAFDLMRNIKRIKDSGVEWLVLETTSHALAQHRVWGVPYSVAVMTNVTHEHLDYHGTFEHYRDAKWRLFKLAGSNANGLQAGIVNADDPSGELFASSVKRPVRYGITHGDLLATDIKVTAKGSNFHARLGQQQLDLKVNLPGSFNVYNALAAAGVGLTVGLTPDQVEDGIAALKNVEGRMNTIDEGQDFSVIVDYAHTPDSFEKVFKEIRPLTKGRLIAVFGSAGRRDKAKRAEQGEIAGRYCDVVIATEEDDRDEDGLAILHEIGEGAKKAGKVLNHSLYLIHPRGQAIKAAVENAEAGDSILLLGKGHEKSIETDWVNRPGYKKPWDEAAEARQALKLRKAKA